MRLKVATTACVLFGLALMIGWPWLVGPRPPASEGPRILAEYGQKLLIYFLLTAGVWLTVAILALIMARRARLDYLEEHREMTQRLIEETLKDHARKR